MAKKLNEKQMAAIAVLALPKRGGLTLNEVAEQVGVHRKTLHEWRQRDDFNKALKDEIVRNTIDDLPEIMESIPKHIIDSGNANLFRTLLQAHGLLTEKHEVSQVSDGDSLEDLRAKVAGLRGEKDGN